MIAVDDDAGFVTSDVPCSVCVPLPPPFGQRPFLGHMDVEVTLPLSPHHLAVYSWKGPRLQYRLGNRSLVDEANLRTISRCLKEFVSWKGIVRDEWLFSRAA
jgi:hypothetical protein